MPSNRLWFTFLNLGIAALPSCAVRALFPIPNSAGKAFSPWRARWGFKIDPAHVIRIDAAGWSMKTGYHPMAPEIGHKPMQDLLEKTRDFTAIFCFNDIAAIGAIRALQAMWASAFPVMFPWSDSTTFSQPPIPRHL